KGLQCPYGGQRADVPGVAHAGGADRADRLPGAVSRDHYPVLSKGSVGTLFGLVREISAVTSCTLAGWLFLAPVPESFAPCHWHGSRSQPCGCLAGLRMGLRPVTLRVTFGCVLAR